MILRFRGHRKLFTPSTRKSFSVTNSELNIGDGYVIWGASTEVLRLEANDVQSVTTVTQCHRTSTLNVTVSYTDEDLTMKNVRGNVKPVSHIRGHRLLEVFEASKQNYSTKNV
ncbi:hypothetical protein NQ317_018361 [Molorchus minor]|uniref:Uncharacterized protein n=1 Tax=Molorchus minor TaxID=1323400 RepID=A0ABQ9JHT7_9CUCU|nr:hypothetical protein NQ317_018361 [Molorchus minor]